MTLITGAGKYLNAATLANLKGASPSNPTLLSQEGSASSMLEAGRGALTVPGMGVSAGTRQMNQALLSRTADINQMFSLGLGADATLEGMRQQILAIRAKLPVSRLGESAIDPESLGDNGNVPVSSNGQNVDTDA